MQIVDFDSGVGPDDSSEPALILSETGTLRRHALSSGTTLSFSLGNRYCAGTYDGDGHVACHRPSAPYCDQHTDTWVCARCTGSCLKDEMDCYEAHAIYFAAFAPDIIKVGVTREWRLETRLREQGADLAAHYRTVPDGRIAREIESELATDLTDRVRVPQKIAGLGRQVDEGVWNDLLASFEVIDTYAFDYGLDLASQPVEETLATGTVVGTKGRILVLEHAGSTYAVDGRDLIGYEISAGDTDRDLQSSLGAFG